VMSTPRLLSWIDRSEYCHSAVWRTLGTSMTDDLALALELADVADELSLPRFRAPDLVVDTKADLTPVTETDRAVEEAIRARLRKERPRDSVVGEEMGAAPATDGATRWIIDPIDGTKNYVRGIPIFATLIAMERDGEMTVGVASAPALRRRWWAARGEGAFADGRPIHVSNLTRPEDGLLLIGGLTTWRRHGRLEDVLSLAATFGRTRGFGDFWMHMLVAEGAAEVATELEVSLWDLAAVQVIVEEAGGRFTDLDGKGRPDGGSALSSNGALHDEALAVLLGRYH
jgi:histidinol-phosphatase